MTPILVAYTTEEGQTEKICDRLSVQLEGAGHEVVLHDIRADASVPDALRAVIIAGSVHMGEHAEDLKSFVHAHHDRLSALPAAFISVSLQAGSPDHQERDVMRTVAENFLEETGFSPLFMHIAGGAVHDAKMGLIERFVMHQVLRQKGVELDPSGDTEFTDWDALDRFCDAFLASLPNTC